jgi:hypothetical protein
MEKRQIEHLPFLWPIEKRRTFRSFVAMKFQLHESLPCRAEVTRKQIVDRPRSAAMEVPSSTCADETWPRSRDDCDELERGGVSAGSCERANCGDIDRQFERWRSIERGRSKTQGEERAELAKRRCRPVPDQVSLLAPPFDRKSNGRRTVTMIVVWQSAETSNESSVKNSAADEDERSAVIVGSDRADDV